ncbi:MAG: hypothetical protein B5M52_05700, partial [Helicobacteraceae bacterium 4484_230]
SHYSLKATARNAQGESEPVDIEISLFTAPQIEPLDLWVPASVAAGDSLGQMRVHLNGSRLQGISLTGEGSSDFRIDNSGYIFVAENVSLDAERQGKYILKAEIKNGGSAILTITINGRIVSTFSQPDAFFSEVALSGRDGVLYAAGDRYDGVAILDISRPGRFEYAGRLPCYYSRSIELSPNNMLAAVNYGNISFYDTTQSSTPSLLATQNLQVRDMHLGHDENLTLSVGYDGNVTIGRVMQNEGVKVLATIAHPGTVDALLSPDDNTLYIATKAQYPSRGHLYIYSLDDPASPKLIGKFEADIGFATRMTFYDSAKRLLLSKWNRLYVYDVSGIGYVRAFGSIVLPDKINNISVGACGDKAYVAANKLYIVDLTDPIALTILGSIDIPGGAKDIVINDNETRAYIAAGREGVHIINTEGFDILEKAPRIKPFEATVEADSAVGELVGRLDVLYSGNSGLSTLEIIGDGAEDFSIDLNGTIRVAVMPDTHKKYRLKARASNSVGVRDSNVTIHVHSVPVIADFDGVVRSRSANGECFGKLDIGADTAETLSSIELVGPDAETFSVDLNGTLCFVGNRELHHFQAQPFKFSVKATNRFGEGKAADVRIRVSALIRIFDTNATLDDMFLYQDERNEYVIHNGRKKIWFDDAVGNITFIMSSIDSDPNAYSWIEIHGTVQDSFLTPNQKYLFLATDEGIYMIDTGSSDSAEIMLVEKIDTKLSGGEYYRNLYVAHDFSMLIAQTDMHRLRLYDLAGLETGEYHPEFYIETIEVAAGDIAGGSSIGRVEVGPYAGGKYTYDLYGDGSDFFRVASDGMLYVDKEAVFDRTKTHKFMLSIKISGIFGTVNRDFFITIEADLKHGIISNGDLLHYYYNSVLDTEVMIVASDSVVNIFKSEAYDRLVPDGQRILDATIVDMAVSEGTQIVAAAMLNGKIALIDPNKSDLPVYDLFNLSTSIYDLAFSEDGMLLFAALGDEGVAVIDTADPSSPTVLNYLDIPGRSVRVFSDWPEVYIVTANAGVYYYDIEDADTEITALEGISGSLADAYLSDEVLAVALSKGGAVLYDIWSEDFFICEPSTAFVQIATGEFVTQDGSDIQIAAMLTKDNKIRLVNIDDLQDCKPLSSITLPSNAVSIELKEMDLYVLLSNETVLHYSISNPYEPVLDEIDDSAFLPDKGSVGNDTGDP